MGLSSQDFRARIGMFYNVNMKQKSKVKYEPKKVMLKNCVCTVAFYLTLLLLMNFLLVNPTSGLKKENTNFKYNLEKCSVKMDSLKMLEQNSFICEYYQALNR